MKKSIVDFKKHSPELVVDRKRAAGIKGGCCIPPDNGDDEDEDGEQSRSFSFFSSIFSFIFGG